MTYSQTIEIESHLYGQDNGLSNYTNYIHKDSRGIIWVGTQFGLYRFDGQEFVHFDEKDGLPFRQVMEIFEDTEGWFWLHKTCFRKPNCNRDLAFFHPLTQKVLTFEERFGDKVSVDGTQVLSIGTDGTTIYFTADCTLLSWSAEEGIREFPINGIKATPVLWGKIRKNILGAFTPDYKEIQLANLSHGQMEIEYLALDTEGNVTQTPQPFPIPEVQYLDFHALRQQCFSIDKLRIKEFEVSFSPEGAFLIDSLDSTLPLLSDSIDYLFFDKRFFSDQSGQIHHPSISHKRDFRSYLQRRQNPQSPEAASKVFWVKSAAVFGNSTQFHQVHVGDYGRHAFFDNETHTAWHAMAEGVYVFEYKHLPFQVIRNVETSNGFQLATEAFEIDENKVLLSFRNAAFSFSPLQFTFSPFVQNYWMEEFSREAGEQAAWYLEDDQLAKINLKTTHIEYAPLADSLRFQVLHKQDDILWLGKKGALYRYFVEQDRLEIFDQYNQFGRFESEVRTIEESPEGYVWIATGDGLYMCHPQKGMLAKYGNKEPAPFYVPADDFYHVSEAKNGGYWLATMNGLIKLDVRDSGQVAYRHFDDLPTLEILAAYEDDFGFVWLATPHGLVQFQPQTGLSKTYLETDGLAHTSFQENAHCRSSDGTLYLGGYNGFTIFHPRDFKEVSFFSQVPLVILDYEQYAGDLDSIVYQLKDITESGEIVLRPGDKFFNLRVGFTDYRGAKAHRFAYRVTGYQENWQEDKSNLIRISGLPYGNYTLQIKGRLHNGQFAQPGLQIPIHVKKPFYLSIGFFLVVFVAFLCGIFVLYQWRTRRLLARQNELELAIREATSTIQEKNERLEQDKQIIEAQAQELKQLDQVKSRFFANVSHELRTPLTLILSPIQSVLRRRALNNRDFTHIKTAERNGQRLLKLVNEILDLSKLESGKLTVQLDPLVLRPFLKKTLSFFEPHALHQEIKVVFTYELDPQFQTRLDIRKTETILFNLLSNALKHTPPGGHVTFLTRFQKGRLVFSIQDTGKGIHPDDLPHIFNRFYQTKRSDVVAEGGTGIGLALSQEYAKIMEGILTVESELGKGSTFELHLPAMEVLDPLPEKNFIEVQQEEEIPVPIHPPYKNQALPTIFIVEDNVDLRTYLQSLLEPHFNLHLAENGQEALTLLAASGASLPSLIISDIMMPVMDGYQLLTHLKESSTYRHLPVMMLTARAAMADKLKALRIGVDDYMLKPFDEEELLVRIDNLLRNARIRQLERHTVYAANGGIEEGQKEVDNPVGIDKVDRTLGVEEREWLASTEQILQEKLSNPDYSVEQLAKDLSLSRQHLNRRIKSHVGMTASEYIKEVRLSKARELLERHAYDSVKVVALESGFLDVRYFGQVYKKRFGRLPSSYL